MSVKVLLIKRFGSTTYKTDITEMITGITWSGDQGTLPRQLDFDMNINQIVGQKALVNVPAGAMIIFYEDTKELFRGYVFKVNTDTAGTQSVTCYDNLIYAVKNTHTILVKNKTASEVISSICKKFSISIGSIPNTVYKIKRKVFQGVALSEIFDEVLIETRRNTKKRYRITSTKGKVSLIPRTTTQTTTLVIDNIYSGSKEVSIENLATQVLVTKGSLENDKDAAKFKTYLAKDSKKIAQYGVIQRVEEALEKATPESMKKLADAILSQNNDPEEMYDFEYAGISSCITGKKIRLVNQTLGVNKVFYISSDSHSWSNGVHTMSLQLSNRLD